MIKKFEIIPLTRDSSKSLTLDLYNPELSGFAVKQATGLGPVKANITMADYASKQGAKFQGSRRGSRTIRLDLVFLDTSSSIEDVRHDSYRWFPVEGKLKMLIETDTRTYITTGYVESNEPTIWSSDLEGTSIQIRCESPFLYTEEEMNYTLARTYSAFHFPFTSLETPELLFGYVYSGDQIEVNNVGEAETGCTMEITALQDISNPIIYNKTDGTYFGVNVNMDANDKIIIDTTVGSKSIVLKRKGSYYNIINGIKDGSTWFSLEPGKTLFAIGHGDEITRIFSDKEAEFSIYRHNYSIDSLTINTSTDYVKEETTEETNTNPTIDKPKELNIPSTIEFSAYKDYWHDDNTDPDLYDYTSKSMTYNRTIADMIADDQEATITADDFGAGYVDINNGFLQVTSKKIAVNLSSNGNWSTVISENKVTTVKERYYLIAMFKCTLTTLKANTEVYSNRFVYHPEFNGASSVDEIVYYFKQMGNEINACYWDNDGKLCIVIAENWDTYSHDHFKYHKAKKKVYWKKHKRKTKTVKKAYYSTSFNANWFNNNNTYFIAQLNEETKVDTPTLDDICDFILFDSAIVDKIKITSADNLIANMKIHKNVNYVYQYLNIDTESNTYTISDGVAGELGYLRAKINFNSEGYRKIIFYINDKEYTIDWDRVTYNEEDYNCPYKWEEMTTHYSGTVWYAVPDPNYDESKPIVCPIYPGSNSGSQNSETPETPDPFYGGYIDPLNGVLTNIYDSEGNLLETPNDIDISDVQLNISVPEGEYTISIDQSVGTITHLIYPVTSGITLDRMNLTIKFNNYFVGI